MDGRDWAERVVWVDWYNYSLSNYVESGQQYVLPT